MSKYNVGDKVKVREDLNIDMKCHFGVTTEMLEYRGKEVTIVSVWKDGVSYCIEGSIYDWEDVMFEGLAVEEPKSKYVKCITSEFELIHKDGIYKVLSEYDNGYVLNQGSYTKEYFVEIKEPSQSIPNKGTIKYRITDDGITYTTLNGSKTGKSIKSNKDEPNNKVGILIATCRLLNINEDKIQNIIDVLFDNDSYDSKAKCDNAIMKNDIARAMCILDKYKEV